MAHERVEAFVEHVLPDGVEVTEYPVMDDPPVEDGADHVKVPLRGLPEVALKLTLVGALGAVEA